MSKPVRRSLAAAATAPLLLLAGCGDRTSSVADPPVSAPSPSSTAGPPRHESPQAFIRRFYAIEEAMENSGSTALYEQVTAACKPCQELVRQVRTIYRAGGYIDWGGLTIRAIVNTKRQTFSIAFSARPTRYVESRGAAVKTLAGGSSTDLLTLRRTSASWVVVARARTAS